VLQYAAMLSDFESLTEAKRNPRGWRRTEETLPAAGENVLYRTGEHQALGVYEGQNCWRCSNGEVEDRPVLLWQPFYSY